MLNTTQLPEAGRRASALTEAPELAVIVPTYNESRNVALLAQALDTILANVAYEIVFVDDDSPDGTASLVRELSVSNPRVRVIQRIGRRGLASACIEGMLATSAPYVAVMDADLQHDESILPRMLETLRAGALDIVVASRNVEGGSMGEFSRARVLLSNLGLKLSRTVSHCEITDPMSGFFVLTRSYLDEVVHRLSGVGFKILLDLIASSQRPVRLAEVPYTFRQRQHGESKLDINVGLEYSWLLIDKLLGDYIPVRFVLFAFVGALGVAAHIGIIAVLEFVLGLSFLTAQSISTVIAMAFNYTLNNFITYRDVRRTGWGFVQGLVVFYIACAIGFFANVAAAEFLFQRGVPWFAAAATGLVISAVWNYGVTAVFVWRIRKRRIRHRTGSRAASSEPARQAE